MHRGKTISAVIPCYNEEDGIQHVIEAMPTVVDEVVVVDNNSSDRTAEVAESLGARVIREKRKGYGRAYQAGLPAASKDVIVTLDGDGSYPPDEIPRLVDCLIDEELDFISACRFPLRTDVAEARALQTHRLVGGALAGEDGVHHGRDARRQAEQRRAGRLAAVQSGGGALWGGPALSSRRCG